MRMRVEISVVFFSFKTDQATGVCAVHVSGSDYVYVSDRV